MKHILIAILMTLTGCASATVTEPSACQQKQVSFPVPAIPPVATGVDCHSLPSVTIPSESTTTVVDLSGSLSKLKDIASNLNVAVTQFVVDNNNDYFDWVGELDVTVEGNGLPSALLAKYTKPSAWSSEMNVQVVMDSNDVLNYLSSGPLNMTLTLQSQTVDACSAQIQENTWAQNNVSSLQTNATLCTSASGNVSKGL
jgi:hypothetical protein